MENGNGCEARGRGPKSHQSAVELVELKVAIIILLQNKKAKLKYSHSPLDLDEAKH